MTLSRAPVSRKITKAVVTSPSHNNTARAKGLAPGFESASGMEGGKPWGVKTEKRFKKGTDWLAALYRISQTFTTLPNLAERKSGCGGLWRLLKFRAR